VTVRRWQSPQRRSWTEPLLRKIWTWSSLLMMEREHPAQGPWVRSWQCEDRAESIPNPPNNRPPPRAEPVGRTHIRCTDAPDASSLLLPRNGSHRHKKAARYASSGTLYTANLTLTLHPSRSAEGCWRTPKPTSTPTVEGHHHNSAPPSRRQSSNFVLQNAHVKQLDREVGKHVEPNSAPTPDIDRPQ
jgi:hypothetical protein